MMLRLLVLLMVAAFHPLVTHAEGNELVVLNWADYLDPEVVGEFEATFGVKVKQIYYESDSERDKIMVKEDGKGFDVLVLDRVSVSAYVKQGWLAPIMETELANLRHLDERWQRDFADQKGYGVPYFWGTLGVAYRSDLVKEPIRSWMQVFHPQQELRGHIIMINDDRDLIGMALKAQGHSINSQDLEQLKQAEALLIEQRPFVRRYGYITLDETSSLVTGEAHISMAYSGDALALQEHEPNIRYVVPQEGGSLWTDYLAVAATGNRTLATSFINFLNRPEIAARNASYVYYPTPNRSALEQMDEEYLHNPVIFPDAATLARCETNQSLPPRVMRHYNMVYSRVVGRTRP